MVRSTKSNKFQSAQSIGLSVGVRLSEVMGAGLRLEASAHALEARQAIAELQICRHTLRPLFGPEGWKNSDYSKIYEWLGR